MSRASERVANGVNDSTLAPVPWQLDLAPADTHWWLVSAFIWASDHRNPRKQIVVAPDLPEYIQALEIGARANRLSRRNHG
jgi:hypothetical protein